MTFAIHSPTPPAIALESCTDEERKIDGRCWDLKAVQQALATKDLKLVLTRTVSTDLNVKLKWSQTDASVFFQCLGLHRYRDSEWCLPAGHNGRFPPMAADAYFMGFDRHRGVEHQPREPWVYFKFTVWEEKSAVLVLSAHPANESD